MEYNKERIEKPDGSGFYEVFVRPVSEDCFQKVTREFIYKTVAHKVPASVVERRKWQKFGDASNNNDSNNNQHTATYGQEVFFEIPSSTTNYYHNNQVAQCVNFWDGSIVDICNRTVSKSQDILKSETLELVTQEPSEEQSQKRTDVVLESRKLNHENKSKKNKENEENEENKENEENEDNKENEENEDNKENEEENEEKNEENNKGICRHCQENHWSFSCPTRRRNHLREDRRQFSREHKPEEPRKNNSRWKSRENNNDERHRKDNGERKQEKPRGDYTTKRQRTLKIMNLPEDAEYAEMMEYFSYYGKIEHLKMIYDKEKKFIGMIILTYIDVNSAEIAITELDGNKYGYSILSVALADDN